MHTRTPLCASLLFFVHAGIDDAHRRAHQQQECQTCTSTGPDRAELFNNVQHRSCRASTCRASTCRACPEQWRNNKKVTPEESEESHPTDENRLKTDTLITRFPSFLLFLLFSSEEKVTVLIISARFCSFLPFWAAGTGLLSRSNSETGVSKHASGHLPASPCSVCAEVPLSSFFLTFCHFLTKSDFLTFLTKSDKTVKKVTDYP